MLSRLLKPCLLTLITAALVCGSLFSDPISAQEGGAGLWYKTAKITYKPKPDRPVSTTRRPPTERKTFLTLQYRLFERQNDNVKEEVSPNKTFGPKDQVKLAVTANQAGYLYIINQPVGQNGVLLFPRPDVNGGNNYVAKNKEYFIPDKCSEELGAEDCWMEWTPAPDIENLIVIFSRDLITSLPRSVKNAGDVIERGSIEKIVANSSKQVKPFTGKLAIPGQKAARFPTWVQNTDTRDNEDLVTIIKIKHGE